jgi:hypothetical protein
MKRIAIVLAAAALTVAFAPVGASAQEPQVQWSTQADGVVLMCPLGDGVGCITGSNWAPNYVVTVWIGPPAGSGILFDGDIWNHDPYDLAHIQTDASGWFEYFPTCGFGWPDVENADCCILEWNVNGQSVDGGLCFRGGEVQARTYDLDGNFAVNGTSAAEWGDTQILGFHYLGNACRCDFTADGYPWPVDLLDFNLFATYASFHPQLRIDPEQHEYEWFGAPEPQDIWFQAWGQAPIQYWITENPESEWLAVDPNEGLIPAPIEYEPGDAEDPNPHIVTITVPDVPEPDHYECTVEVTSTCVFRPQIDILVSLMVDPGGASGTVSFEVLKEVLPPAIMVDKTTVAMEPEQGGSDCDTLTINNWGDLALEWAIVDTCPWSSPIPASGTVDPATHAEVVFCTDDLSGLSPLVEYTCEFSLDSNDPHFPSIPIHGTLFIEPGTGVEEPLFTRLGQNYPNPFNPRTSISFTVAEPGHVALRVYDLTGRLVRTLADEQRSPNEYQLYWDGRDDAGKQVGSGVYYYSLEIGQERQTKKMVLLK